MARKRTFLLMLAVLCIAGITVAVAQAAASGGGHHARTSSDFHPQRSAKSPTTSPIKHLVVIFQENVSFDHYFGTYPNRGTRRMNRPSTPPGRRRPSTASPERC